VRSAIYLRSGGGGGGWPPDRAEGRVVVHTYSTEYSHARLYSVLATVAVVVAIAVNAASECVAAIPSWLVSAPTLGAVFVSLLDWVEKDGWRREWLRRLAKIEEPDVAGLYEGNLISVWQGGTTLPVELDIQQRWSRILVRFKVNGNETSSSYSIAAALVSQGDRAARLTYAYRNQPNPGIAEADMGDHDGTAEVTITVDGDLTGRYYNFRGRQGSLQLARVTSGIPRQS